MKIKTLIGTSLVALSMALGAAGCAGTGGQQAAAKPQAAQSAKAAEFERIYQEAVAARKKAASVGFEWRDIGKFLKKAKAAAKKGDYDKAIKLARKAKAQGELGYQQYLSQRNAGPHNYGL